MIGTAPFTRGWLLIEHPGPWRSDAFDDSGIASAVRARLSAEAREREQRILFIRRPGRSRSAVRRWAVVGPSGSRWGAWERDEDLLGLIEAAGPVSLEPLLLVCTHGVHDACCAVRGRPVAAALSGEWPEATWECTHVGGDRFAANLVVLPDGAYYGLLDPDTAVATVRDHLDGGLPLGHLRGLATLEPPAQAALATAYETLGPLPRGAITPLNTTTTGPRQWTITLDAPTGPLRALVTAAPGAVAQLTCRASGPSRALEYHVRLDAG